MQYQTHQTKHYKLWVDDIRPCPDDTYHLCQSTRSCIETIKMLEDIPGCVIDLIDLDHDAGVFAQFGGDYIKILDWLEENGRNYPIRLHTMNVVGMQNMRAIIQRNGWKEVF